MQIDPAQQATKDNYKLLIGSILPRPIAFVTSMDTNGVVNAAPFSFFNVVGTEPPMISISCIRKPGGREKDTARNIRTTGEFVVQVVDKDNVEEVNEASTEFPSGVSEVEMVGLKLLPSDKVAPPRVKKAKIHMECRLQQIIPIGAGEGDHPNADLIIGEVILFHIKDELLFEGKIDTAQLDPLGRLAGVEYGSIGERFAMPRLPYEEWIRKQSK
ncbi:flavin reductase family protein [Mechercharimyces sp. CAU 1602]|uniref:flavin reductase family protein n=1 Tax=Mechercharimyces sp. CAU 1602 TaxID=2973933 RepID=UPI002161CABD|nr:flavin reductase family protein [Mechercharimyces sp. CAU 1602]MCS1350691.1 flavin reductase family protein [Mechercharimyces sp. CAU 1602]